MKSFLLCAVACFALLPSKVLSQTGTPAQQGDTFTQVGTWKCFYEGPELPQAHVLNRCDKVIFPRPFGGPSHVVFSGCFFSPVLRPVGNGQQVPFPGKLIQCANSVDAIPPYGKPFSLDGPDASQTMQVTQSPDDPDNRSGFVPLLRLDDFIVGASRAKVFASGNWVAVGPRIYYGKATAKYLVLTVVYAPPGTEGGKSSSSVSYEAGSTTGTTTSANQSFKETNTISFDGSAGFLGNGLGGGLSFEWSHSTSDDESVEITKSVKSQIKVDGPAFDGIDHDEDRIYLLLEPTIDLSLSNSAASWLLESSSLPIIQAVSVGQLKGKEPIPKGVLDWFQNAGITTQDYPDILARDPLASGSAVPDPARFIPLNTTFPYLPPTAKENPVQTITTTISGSSTQTNGSETEDSYKVGLYVKGNSDFLDVEHASLKDSASWQWTNKSSQKNAVGTTQSATVTIGGPAFGYSGQTLLAVYTDSIYHTFAFALVPVPKAEEGVTGIAVDANGKPLIGTEVMLVENGISHRTFSDSKGTFAFYGKMTGPATLRAGGITKVLPQIQPATAIELKLP